MENAGDEEWLQLFATPLPAMTRDGSKASVILEPYCGSLAHDLDPMQTSSALEEGWAEAPQNLQPFIPKYKVVRCWYFDNAQCKHGDACTFAHGDQELMLPPAEVAKRVPCMHFLIGSCENGAACPFGHCEETAKAIMPVELGLPEGDFFEDVLQLVVAGGGASGQIIHEFYLQVRSPGLPNWQQILRWLDQRSWPYWQCTKPRRYSDAVTFAGAWLSSEWLLSESEWSPSEPKWLSAASARKRALQSIKRILLHRLAQAKKGGGMELACLNMWLLWLDQLLAIVNRCLAEDCSWLPITQTFTGLRHQANTGRSLSPEEVDHLLKEIQKAS